MILIDPSRLWFLSSRLHRSGHRLPARLIKAYVFAVFRAILPPEALLEEPVRLGHYASNVVVHPCVTLGREVRLWHNVTIAVSGPTDGDRRIIVRDRVTLGTGVVVISREDEDLEICADVRVGAGSVVTRSISVPGTYVGSPAKRVG